MNLYAIGLVYPFHINHVLKSSISEHYYNENYVEFHKHSFNDIVKAVYADNKAFYLTDEDKEYYSKQELEIIGIIQNKNNPMQIKWCKSRLGFYCPRCDTNTTNIEHRCNICDQLLIEYGD